MSIVLKVLLRIILVVVVIAALAVGAVWGFCYFKFKVNVFSVVGSLNQLNKNVEIADVAPKAVKDSDMEDAMNAANASIPNLITKDAEGNYTINDHALPLMVNNMVLTDKEVCSIINTLIKNGTALNINVSGSNIDLKEYKFTLIQFDFNGLDTENNTVKFNAVASINLDKIKEKMSSFPLSIFKSRVPQTLYISNTVTIKKLDEAFTYEIEADSITANNLPQNKVEEIFTLINGFTKIGTASEFSKIIGQNLANAFIGNSSNEGFAYKLKDAGATDFNFEKDGDNINFVIKKLI